MAGSDPDARRPCPPESVAKTSGRLPWVKERVDLCGNTSGQTGLIGKDPFGRRSHDERAGSLRIVGPPAPGHREVLKEVVVSKDAIEPLDSRATWTSQPGDNPQQITRVSRLYERDVVPARDENPAELSQPRKVKPETGRVVDRRLFEIVQIGRIVYVAQGVNLVKPHPDKRLECPSRGDFLC